MKNILSTLLLGSGLMLSAQVGINTDSPKAKLDVNGDITLRKKKIAVLDVTANTLSEGNNDQLLVSQGQATLLSGRPFVFQNMSRTNFT